MTNIKLFSKVFSLLLIVAILFTACDIPDISKFTEASAEMTRGIRKGIKETEQVLANLAETKISSQDAKDKIKESSKNYSQTIKPTLKSMDALDAYLEALNALALANKKSEENAEATVKSVGNLVNAISGLQIPDTALKIATVFTSILNQIKTSRDFKRRVTLVELLVNGGSSDSNRPCVVNYAQTNKNLRSSLENLFPNISVQRLALENPLHISESDFETPNKALKEEISALEKKIKKETNSTELNKLKKQKEEKETSLSKINEAKEGVQKLYDDKILSFTEKERDLWLKQAGDNFCGIIDILKLNMQELNKIQNSANTLISSNYEDENKTLIKFHDQIIVNDKNVMKKLNQILFFKSQTKRLIELIYFNENKEQIDKQKSTIKETIGDIYAEDNILKKRVCEKLNSCSDTTFEKEIANLAVLEELFETREKELNEENNRLLADLQRIETQYLKVTDDLNKIKSKQTELNEVFESSIEALDIWGQTHSNLRISLNTKKPLTVSRLISKTKEIWTILEPSDSK